MGTVFIHDNRVTGFATRRTDPEATRRVIRDTIATTPEGVEFDAAFAALRAVPPCRCDRLRRADPVDAVRWFNDVSTCKARIVTATAAYEAKRAELLPACRQYFELRDGEQIVENHDALRAAFAGLKPGELLRPDGTIEVDAAAVAAHEAARAAAEQEARRVAYLDAKIAELDAFGTVP
jgi:hypothetical protein